MKKKIISMILVMSMSVGLFVGCSNSDTSKSENKSNQSDSEFNEIMNKIYELQKLDDFTINVTMGHKFRAHQHVVYEGFGHSLNVNAKYEYSSDVKFNNEKIYFTNGIYTENVNEDFSTSDPLEGYSDEWIYEAVQDENGNITTSRDGDAFYDATVEPIKKDDFFDFLPKPGDTNGICIDDSSESFHMTTALSSEVSDSVLQLFIKYLNLVQGYNKYSINDFDENYHGNVECIMNSDENSDGVIAEVIITFNGLAIPKENVNYIMHGTSNEELLGVNYDNSTITIKYYEENYSGSENLETETDNEDRMIESLQKMNEMTPEEKAGLTRGALGWD